MQDPCLQVQDLLEVVHDHLQPAEPTTMGYRLALYAQDLLEDYRQLSY